MRPFAVVCVAVAVSAAALLWYARERAYEWQLPPDMPPPAVPDDNPMSAAKVELGRWLFYDTRLSVNETMSCASCHVQALAFTDGKPQSAGATGELHPRSAMSLVNAAYASRLTWANPLLDRLEDQALTPLLGDNPIEMGLGSQPGKFAALLGNDPRYRTMTAAAFPDDTQPHSLLNGVRAISAFVRSIVGFDSAYDRYLAGDDAALDESALRGMNLFFSEELECFHCHGGFNFSDSTTHENARVDAVGYHNTGLYNLGGSGDYPPDNTGLFDMTGERRDMGRFKAPTLRNVAVTAPYMHDGSVASLAEAITHYARGGRLVTDGERAGDGRLNPYKSEFVRGFELDAAGREDLVAFLQALTDERVLTDSRFANPHKD